MSDNPALFVGTVDGDVLRAASRADLLAALGAVRAAEAVDGIMEVLVTDQYEVWWVPVEAVKP